MLRLLRDVFIIFCVCVVTIAAINTVAWLISNIEQAAEEVVEEVDETKISELSGWYDIYRVALIPALEIGLIVAFIGMVIGIFIYSRKR